MDVIEPQQLAAVVMMRYPYGKTDLGFASVADGAAGCRVFSCAVKSRTDCAET